MAELDYQQENKKITIRALIVIAGIIVVSLIIFNLFRYSYTTIKINDTTGSDAGYNVVLKDRETGETAYSYLLDAGDNEVSGFMRRDDYVAEVLTQKAETRKSFSSSFLFTNIDVSLEPQLASQKISYTNESCLTQNSDGDAVSHSCLRETPLFMTKYFDSGVQKSVINDLTENIYKNYLSGVMALEENYDSRMLLDFRGLGFEQDAQVEITEVIDGFQNGEPVGLITDTSPVDKSAQFEIYDYNRSRLLVFEGVGDSEPTTIDLNQVINDPTESASFLFTQNGDEVIAYYGLSDFSPDSEEETEIYEQYGGGALIFFDNQGGNHEFITLPKELLANGIRVVSNFLIVETEFNIDIYDLGDRSGLKKVTTIPLAQRPLVYDSDSFLFVIDNNIYRYDLNDQSYKLLYSGNRFVISALNVVGEKIYASAFLNGDSTQSLHGFVLTKNAAEFPRIEERLPYSPGTAGVSYMDYYENNIFIYLSLASFDYRNGTYDESEFESKKSDFLQRFEADGFNPADFNISFFPS